MMVKTGSMILLGRKEAIEQHNRKSKYKKKNNSNRLDKVNNLTYIYQSTAEILIQTKAKNFHYSISHKF